VTLSPRTRWTVTTLVLTLGAGLLAFRPAPSPHSQADPLTRQRTRGSDSAAVTVYEMSDFQCPWCRKQALETLPLLEQELIATGKVRWIFLNYPIPSLHPNAVAAAELGMCAAKFDHFWPIHDLLFTYQEKWAPLKDPAPFLISLADSAGIPREDILPCLQNHEMQALVQEEAEGAAKSGATGTPTLYVEGAGLVRGAVPGPRLLAALTALWQEKTGDSTATAGE